MADLLIKLYDLPAWPDPHPKSNGGPTIRPAMAYEKHQVVAWVRASFGEGWASECDVAFSNHPISCYIAVERGEIAGFACYDCACRGFFGPLGVSEECRGHGIGRALLLACLHAMAATGYAYAVVGYVDSAPFYVKNAAAIEIPDSTPGIYRDRLKVRGGP